MHRIKKWLNAILVITLICTTLFLGPVNNVSAASEESTPDTIEEPVRLYEVVGLREKDSKTYQLSDGSYEFVGYAEDINYEDAQGNLKEINNAITDKPTKEGYSYSNTANSWHTYFSDSLCEKDAVVLETDKYALSFCMVNAQISSKAAKSSALNKEASLFDEMLADDNRSVVYKDVLNNVDIAYTVSTSGLKEDIILRAASAPNVFEFDVTLDSLNVIEKEGTVCFVNNEGQGIFKLAPMYMEDANGKYSDKVEYTIDKVEGGCRITITADKEFLNSPDTQYPVILDPSYDRMITGSSFTFDTCVDQQYPNSNYYLSQNLWTGGLLGTNAMRTFIKFTLPTDIAAASVTNAYLRIKMNAYAIPTIKAYRVTTSWNSNEVKWAAPYQPSWNNTPVSITAVNDSGDWYRLNNLTTTVRYWMNGTYLNYGFVLKEPSESSTTQKTRFYSSDAPSPNKPELHIVYNDTVYTITYNGNGNTGGLAPASQSVYAGQSIPLRTNIGNLTKTGYTLIGWSINSSGIGTSYSLGQTITPSSSLTLYARWGTTGITTNRIYTIKNTLSNLVMNVYNGNTVTNTAVKQYVSNGVANQKFRLSYVSNGEYKIEPMHTAGLSMVLSLNSSKQLVIDTDSSSATKRWYIIKSGSNYNIVNKAYIGEFLSVNGSTSSGANIYSSTNSSGAYWQITPVNVDVTVSLLRHASFNTTFGANAYSFAYNTFDTAKRVYFNRWGLDFIPSQSTPTETFFVDTCQNGYFATCAPTCSDPPLQCDDASCTNKHKCSHQFLHEIADEYPTTSGLVTCFHTFCGNDQSRGFLGGYHSVVYLDRVDDPSTPTVDELVWNVLRIMHEIGHNFGIIDNTNNTCVDKTIEPCLMNEGFDYNYTLNDLLSLDTIWCSNCEQRFDKNKFN